MNSSATLQPEPIEPEQDQEQKSMLSIYPTTIPPESQNFKFFPHLPPELRVLILNHALANCYVSYQRIKSQRSFNNSLPSSTPSGSSSATNTEYTYTHRLDKHRWMRLMLSCRTAYELVKHADEDVRKELGNKKYWIYGRKWDEMVAFYRENGKGGLEEFDSDPEFRW